MYEIDVKYDVFFFFIYQVNKIIERETEIAKELLKKGQKDRALLALKKKKLQEALLDKLQSKFFINFFCYYY